jgi:pimeloyl-ACP methyl ester carboxylesterase
MLAMIAADRVVGVHLTGTAAAMPFGPPLDVESLPAGDRLRAERFNQFQSDGLGYLHLQATRPQTLGYALTDSPVGQLAWIVEKFREWTDPAAALPEDAVDRDQLLTNVSIFWFTGAGASSAHATYDGMQAWREFAAQSSSDWGDQAETTGPPTGYAVFAADTAIRRVADPGGHVEHWSEYDRGGHFPAMETPELLSDDIRDFFRKLR